MLGGLFYAAYIVAFVFLTYRKPHAALVAILCMFGLEQLGQLYIPYLRSNGIFTNLFVLMLTGGAVCYQYFLGRLSTVLPERIYKARNYSIALFVFALISLLWTQVDGWFYWQNKWPYVIVSLVLAPMLIRDIRDLEEVQKVFIWLGGIMVIFLAFIPEWGARTLLVDGSEEEMEPLALAQLAGYLVIIGTVHLKKSYLTIFWLIIVILSALILSLKTGSRGQFIFSIVSAFIVMPLAWKNFTFKNAIQLAVIGTLFATASFYVFDSAVTHESRWEADQMLDDLLIRFEMVKIVLSAWIQSPLTIVFGLGNSASISEQLNGAYPHMVSMEILGEEGLIGFTLFAMVVGVSILHAIRFNAIKILSKDVRRVYAASFGCFLFTFLLSFKQGSLITSPMLFFFAVISEKYFYLTKLGIYTSDLYLRREDSPGTDRARLQDSVT